MEHAATAAPVETKVQNSTSSPTVVSPKPELLYYTTKIERLMLEPSRVNSELRNARVKNELSEW